jgi:peptide/nickel transport system ATP-binding protein
MSGGLRLLGLSLRHAGQRVLDDVSLEIRQGESLCLVGASGGGKSLIAAAIAGLLPACMQATGQVHLGGEVRQAADQAGLRSLWHRQSCLLPQEPSAALAPLLRAVDQVRLDPPRLSRPAAREFLARFGLDRTAARRLPAELSGGMAQRLLSALVARSQAGLLIVDEPTKGLDPSRRADIVAMLVALREAGRALLVITHDLDVVRALGGRLAVLDGGAIAEAGPSETRLAAPHSRFLRACLAAEPAHWRITRKAAFGDIVAAADSLVIARDRRTLAGPLALSLKQGQITALLGASGVGKTTLGDTLLGLERAAAGQIRWFGRPLDRLTRRSFRQRFQKLHQDPTAVFPATRTFGDGLADLHRLTGGDVAARTDTLLEHLRVSRDLLARRPGEVSGGEAQRLALVRLLAVRPALLVADEPSSRLDLPTQAETMLLLRTLADETQLSVLLITHDENAAAAIADHRLALGGV